MNSDKIIQVIPAPADMWARFKADGNNGGGACRVVCLALVEDGSGCRDVRPMIADGDGVIEFVDAYSNFDGLEWDGADGS